MKRDRVPTNNIKLSLSSISTIELLKLLVQPPLLLPLIILCLFSCKCLATAPASPPSSQKVVVVTGASRGIGLSLTKELLNEKFKVIAIVRHQQSLAELAKQYPNELQVIEADLSTTQGQNNIAAKIQDSQIHYLVNNAGVIEPLGTEALLEAKPETLRKIFETNIMAPILLTNSLGPKLKEGSRVLNISSVAGDKATAGLGAYCITKVALDRFSESLQLDHPHGILATSVHPGRVDTDMQADLRNHSSKDFISEKYIKYKTEHKLISTEKVAKYLKWLLINSTDAQFLIRKHDIEDATYQEYWNK